MEATSASWEPAVHALLDELGMDPASVSVDIWQGEAAPMYSPDADIMTGLLTWHVVLARYQGYDVISWPLFDYGLASCDNFIAASASRLAGDEACAEQSARFLEASYRGWVWAVSNPQQAVDIMIDMFPEMRSQREYYTLAFDASIPLIQYSHKPVGSLENIGGLSGSSPYPARLYEYPALPAAGEAP